MLFVPITVIQIQLILIQLLHSKTNAQSVYSNEFAIELQSCEDGEADSLAKEHGFVNHGPIGTLLECHFRFSHPGIEKRSTENAQSLSIEEDSRVVWYEQQKILKREKRSVPENVFGFRDPLYPKMWYLNSGARGGFDMNVQKAWNLGFTGKGVVVTILDDGIQRDHPDLILNYDQKASLDVNDGDQDPMPQDNGSNAHGTRCAGQVAAEAGNLYCGVGVAYNSSIGGIRMLDGTVTDLVEAQSIGHEIQHVDVYSASWGPTDDGFTLDGPGHVFLRTYTKGIKEGRKGRGSIYIWSSGNGGKAGDCCGADGYQNLVETITVGAATERGTKPWYLEECAGVMPSTYSSGTRGLDREVVTCDVDTKFSKDLCTEQQTGTSAAAPMASGIIALALEANPELSWRDVQHLIVQTSRQNPLKDETGWNQNGAGKWFSHSFGFGLMDAEGMVNLARKWKPIPEQKIVTIEYPITESKEIPIQKDQFLELSIQSPASNRILNLEHVQARLTAYFHHRGHLAVSLESPLGTKAQLLQPRPLDFKESLLHNWTFLALNFWGENPAGEWKLRIGNQGRQEVADPGKLLNFTLILYGTEDNPFPGPPSTEKPKTCFQKGLYQAHNSTECLTQCPQGQFIKTSTGRCDLCNRKCLECIGLDESSCILCPNGTFLHKFQCVQECPENRFPETGQCLSCAVPNCSKCEYQANNCMECEPGFRLNGNSGCIYSKALRHILGEDLHDQIFKEEFGNLVTIMLMIIGIGVLFWIWKALKRRQWRRRFDKLIRYTKLDEESDDDEKENKDEKLIDE